ncbi:MAG: elongation factor Ts [Clostridiales bacterium]|jgi:elongation factor Ts|nr:elongation factor Ts [Clostridiales bacterium]
MAFTAQDVKDLREKTGVGMMDCKKALTEADGDMEKAIDLLREKGLAAAAKKATRIAAEGMVYAVVDEAKKVGVVVEVNAETDFVAKNADFQNFVKDVAAVIIDHNPADVEALLALSFDGKQSVADALRDKILVIGENLSIRRFARYEGDCVAYVHGGGRIGVLVSFEADGAASGSDALKECGKDVAMQIAALNASYLDKSTVPAEALEKEKEILVAQIKNDPKNASKPENIIQKMVDGRIGKFYENSCLLQQAYVKNGDITVGQYVDDMAKQAGGSMKVVDFVRFEKGEGLQKREDNFAEEVASMMK